MNKNQLIEAAMSGKPVCLVEYRSSVPDVINWRDEQTGRTIQIKKVVHNVEAGPVALQITERLADNVDLTSYKPPFKKGQMVVWYVESTYRSKGVQKNTGRLEPFEQ